jgi:hypothetical protein
MTLWSSQNIYNLIYFHDPDASLPKRNYFWYIRFISKFSAYILNYPKKFKIPYWFSLASIPVFCPALPLFWWSSLSKIPSYLMHYFLSYPWVVVPNLFNLSSHSLLFLETDLPVHFLHSGSKINCIHTELGTCNFNNSSWGKITWGLSRART